jgi:hypothetical protein
MKPKIEKIEFGEIIVNGKNYGSKDLILYWYGDIETRAKSHVFTKDEIETILEKEPEIIIIGTGFYDCVKVDNDAIELAKSKNVEIRVMNTVKACEEYSKLSNKVVLVVHTTC